MPEPATPTLKEQLESMYNISDARDDSDTPLAIEVDDAPAPPAPVTPPRNDKGQFVSPATVGHSAHMLGIAESYGITPEEAAGLSPEALTQALGILRRQEIASRAVERQLERPTPSVQPTAPEVAPVADDVLPFPTEGWDPTVVAFLRSQAQEIKALKDQIGQVNQREATREAVTVDEHIDEAFAALPDELKALFGSAPLAELDRKSVEAQRRGDVFALAKLTKGMTGKQIKQRITDTVNRLFKGVVAAKPAAAAPTPAPSGYEAVANGDRITPAQWEQSTVERPTRRKTPAPVKGPQRATQVLAEKLREAGADDEGAGGDQELNGFLD